MNLRFHHLTKSPHGFDQLKTSSWIMEVIELEKKEAGSITVIFCSDEYLLDMNRKYLQHDTLTDIITFDYGDNPSVVSGDLFISIERVSENAAELGVLFDDELHRVIVHGILHLMGYDDKRRQDKDKIRRKEDYYLQRRS